MTAEHNHQPRCCCDDTPDMGGTGPCPACPEHGELAPAIECPQCHQPIGRPHTDFCTLAPDRVWPDPAQVRIDDIASDRAERLRRCPVVGYDNIQCFKPQFHDGSHEWSDPAPLDDLVGHLRDAVGRARERRTRGSQP